MIYNKVGDYISNKFKLNPKFLIENSFWINLEWGISRLIKILFNIFIVRYVSVKMYGDYNYVLSLLGLLALLSLSGFQSAVLREIARKNLKVFIKWVELGVKFSYIGSATFLILAFLKYFSQPFLSVSLLLCAVFFPPLYKYLKWDTLLFGLMRFKKRALYTFFKNMATYLPLAIVVLFFRDNIVAIIFAYLALNLMTDFLIYHRSTHEVKFSGYSNEWVKSGANLSISSGLAVVYSYADKIILFHLMGSEPLAIYAVATYISENLKIVTSNNIRMYFPKIWSKEDQRVLDKLSKVKLLLFLYPLAIFIGTYLLTPFIIELFYGGKYASSVRFGQIYAIILPLHFFYLLIFSWYVKIQKESHIAISSVLSAAATLLAYFILVPIYGILGAVLGSIIYYLSKLLYFFVLYLSKALSRTEHG